MFVENIKHKNVWFWSDLHLGHNRDFIYGPRGFTDVQTHDATLLKRAWKIPQDATVWLLGDTIFGMDSEARLVKVLTEFPGKEIYLMPGNHYSGLKQLFHKNGRRFQIGDKQIRIMSNLEDVIVDGQTMALCHYPIMSWNGAGKGAWMIHGHVHGRIKGSLHHELSEGKIIDVGVEACPEPLSFAEIKTIMDRKPFKQVDHHGGDTQNPF